MSKYMFSGSRNPILIVSGVSDAISAGIFQDGGQFNVIFTKKKTPLIAIFAIYLVKRPHCFKETIS